MDKLIDIYKGLHNAGAVLFDRRLNFSNGAKSAVLKLKDRPTYGVFIDTSRMTLREEVVGVAHEAGHVATGSTHEICSPFDVVMKHEHRADKWAIKKLIPKDELSEAVRQGYTEPWELAERFVVTEPFMIKAIEYYKAQELYNLAQNSTLDVII